MSAAVATTTTKLIRGFDDPVLDCRRWTDMLRRGQIDTVFLTWHWQRTWWEIFGRGQLLLVVAEENGVPIALAPLFCDGGMIYFVGSGGSDYLDFIGDTSPPGVLEALLDTARAEISEFVGFCFYHVPDGSRTPERLQRAADALGLSWFDEGSLPAPLLELQDLQVAQAAANKKSLVRHERTLAKTGTLQTTHLRQPAAIRGHLEQFFQQHIERWASSPTPSLFHDPAWRRFFVRLTESAGDVPWLRFTCVEWNEQPVAYHFGFHYEGLYLWYKPSFDISMARQSPGEVLLRQLLLAGIDEGAEAFDFGLGDEAFKLRFATRTRHVQTIGLYPPEVIA